MVTFSKVYCGSWSPYMIDSNDQGFNTSKKFNTIKEVLQYTNAKGYKKVDSGWYLNQQGTKKIIPIYELIF
jgi:hypothetical protein